MTRSGTAQGYVGHFHEVGFFSSDDELRGLLVPWIEEGLGAGEPVIVGYDARKTELLRSWLSDPDAVTFLDGQYASPARTIAAYKKRFVDHLAAGAQQIRIAGEAPHPGNGGRFEGWDRYESAVKVVWGEVPVWGRCLYDAQTTQAAVRDFAERVHPFVVTAAGGTQPNARYEERAELELADDPIEQSRPAVTLADPSEANARHAVQEIGHGRLSDETLADLLLGVSEAVSNAHLHGRPPVSVEAWAAADRIVVRVRDAGSGPTDPLVGLRLTTESESGNGIGLWLVHQLTIDIDLLYEDGSFTIRLRGHGDRSH